MVSPGTARLSAKRAFLERLIDDAGLFPPASLDMAAALRGDARARTGPHSWMLGRFVVPAGRLADLACVLGESGMGPLAVSAIVDGGHAARDIARVAEFALGATAALDVEALEIRLPDRPDGDVRRAVLRVVADVDAGGLGRSVAGYLEFSFGADWRSHVATVLDAIADARARSAHPIAAKIRCGGLTAQSVPSGEQLAFAIGTLRALGIPWKATAGLHHPVRAHVPAAGFTMHGFLNVIGAAILDAALDLDARTRERILAEDGERAFRLDDDGFAWRDLRADGVQVASARRSAVHAFGSCSFEEPVADLEALGILT